MVSFGRRLIMLGVTMGILGTWWGSARSIAELPIRVSPNAIIGSSDRVFILGDQFGEYIPGTPPAAGGEAVAFEIQKADGSLQRTALGPGFVIDASDADGVIYAVRIVWSPDRPEVGHVHRSEDGGKTWSEISGAPTDIIGVEFASKNSGWVWSSRALYHTDDAGASWSRIEAPGLLPRGRDYAHPAIDHEGTLWMATDHGPGWKRQGNAIARALPGPRVETLLRDADFRVTQLDVSSEGDLWLVVDDGNDEHVRLMRLPSGEDASALSKVADLPAGLPIYLRVLGREIVVALSETEGDDPKVFLMVSRDGGASWKRQRPPESRVRAFDALSADKIWMVGSSGAVYAPQ
jgi:hypothetical protein